MDRPLQLRCRADGGHTGFIKEMSNDSLKTLTLRQVLKRLNDTYCRHLGVEYMHIHDRQKCNWIRTRVEDVSVTDFSREKKMKIYERLCYAETFESFMGNKFNTTKRFGLDGGEAVIPGLKAMLDLLAEQRVTDVIFGMPHRGRLNTLANVVRKPMQQIFKEFQELHYDLDAYLEGVSGEDWSSSGDVKYHLGTTQDVTYPNRHEMHLALVANPSHLEAVDPVVVGKAYAKQFYRGNTEQSKKEVVPVLLHGDAAFAGQGVVYETMQMANLRGFGTGGTIHVIVNNQIGYTTNPEDGRSTPYCSDLGKAFQVPIFHCNGDDPLSVVAAFELATAWRQDWGEDVIVDVVCYRRMGHNEMDQPLFTQPRMYSKIQNHPTPLKKFAAALVAAGVATQAELDVVDQSVLNDYQNDFDASAHYEPRDDWVSTKWASFKSPNQVARRQPTGVDEAVLHQVGLGVATLPDNFSAHRQVQKVFEQKLKTIEEGAGIDWGTAEALAFGTLLLEGNHVRLSGQDVERGTFSHRHAVVHDQKTFETHHPLNSLATTVDPSSVLGSFRGGNVQGHFTAINSLLSEYGVLGFELGYSLENPNSLILWEAQFGDFANGAQVMIDQFISAGEDKWLRQSGLTMLLPHGYDGAGAEHSSCRLERFLQMSADDDNHIPVLDDNTSTQIQHNNLQVLYCTTPANYFHALRRQVCRDFRKPLVVAVAKNLLRHRSAVSSLADMGPDSRFQRVIPEVSETVTAKASEVRRLVLCSGKLYYELAAAREATGRDDIALVRVEQIAPFPFDRVAEQVNLYPNAEVVWAQEEPHNMGAWAYVHPRIDTAVDQLCDEGVVARSTALTYIGRPAAAAPAVGMPKVHAATQQAIINQVLDL